MRPTGLVVAGTRLEADGVVSLELVDPAGAALPAWQPGDHLDVAVGEYVRQYSLCGDPADLRSYRVAVLRVRDSRGGSAWVHERCRPGDVVEVTGPRSTFRLPDLTQGTHLLFVAGGVGITPLLPMVAAAHSRGADWRLVYLGRSRTSMAFRDALAPYGGRVQVWASDERGRLDVPGLLAATAPATEVYCCGPESLLAAVESSCAMAGLAVHTERFAPRPVSDAELAARGADESFEVLLSRSGTTVTVPADSSIIEALEAEGIFPDCSCLEGTCGTCETGVLEGTPDHRDSLLDDDERASGETMLICVSRSCTPTLVLDL